MRPRSARRISADSSRMTWIWRGSLPCSAASRCASAARLDRGQVDEPALGLGDHLVGDGEHVGGAQLGGGREQRREVVAGAHLRQPGQRVELDHTVAACSTARVRAAAPGRASSAVRRAARSAGVSTSSPSEGSSADLDLGARGARERGVAGERTGAERRRHDLRRLEQQRVRPGAVAVGDDHHAATALEQRRHLSWVERRAVARARAGRARRPAPVRRRSLGRWRPTGRPPRDRRPRARRRPRQRGPRAARQSPPPRRRARAPRPAPRARHPPWRPPAPRGRCRRPRPRAAASRARTT